MGYAETTKVPVQKTLGEIRDLLRRHGADEIAQGEQGDTAWVLFSLEGRRLKFRLNLLPLSEFNQSPAGRNRSRGDAAAAHERDARMRWRNLLLIIRAKLEAVASGIVSLDEEFLGNIVLPNGQTVAEHTVPQIEQGGHRLPKGLPLF